jgi:hypothetical protein
MAVLTANGVTFSDGTNLNSKYGLLPQGSVKLFYQAAAPTGWTQNTSHNDKALRCVSGTGGGSGGSISFTSAFPNTNKPFSGTLTVSTATFGGTALSTPQIAVHAHPNGFGAAGRHGWRPGGEGSTATGNNGSGSTHTHPWSGSGPFSGTVDLRVQYVDVIACSLN